MQPADDVYLGRPAFIRLFRLVDDPVHGQLVPAIVVDFVDVLVDGDVRLRRRDHEEGLAADGYDGG